MDYVSHERLAHQKVPALLRLLGPPASTPINLVIAGVKNDVLIDASSPSHFERYRHPIDTFDEDRQNWFEKLVHWLFLLLAYGLPVTVAYAMGKEISDACGGALSWSDGWSLGTHVVAMAGEFALAMMTLSATNALRRMATDPGYAPKFVGSVASFLLFSLASGLAQWFIASQHITTPNTISLLALVFLVTMIPAVDIASLLFLAVMSSKSLEKWWLTSGYAPRPYVISTEQNLRSNAPYRQRLVANRKSGKTWR